MDYREAIKQRLFQNQQAQDLNKPTGPVSQASTGNPMDPRGLLGQFLRGSNVYGGGRPNAHNGGPNIGRPTEQGAIARRLGV